MRSTSAMHPVPKESSDAVREVRDRAAQPRRDLRFDHSAGPAAPLAGRDRAGRPGGWEGDADLPPGASTVTITLEPTEGGTIVRLVHEELTDEQAASHGQGWSHYLDRLVPAATTGDAGTDDWMAPEELDAIKAAEAALAICQLALRGVAEADYGSPTICPEFTITQLTDHLIGSVTALGGAAGAEFPGTATGTLEARLAEAAQAAMEAWNARGADGAVKVGPSELP